MKSTVKLFRISQLIPSKNAYIDNMAEYLAGQRQKQVINDFQYIKHDLDITIRVEKDQSNVNDLIYNYVSIQNEDQTKPYYYFIMDKRWLSTSTIELSLSLDTINTFQNDYQFLKQTNIKRQHKDRFIKPISGSALPNSYRIKNRVDKVDEGINGLTKFNNGNSLSIIDKSGYFIKWYLIYVSDKNISTNPNEIVPISCYLAPERDFRMGTDNIGDVVLTKDNMVAWNEANGGNYYYIFTSRYNNGKKLIIDDRNAGPVTLTVTTETSILIYRNKTDVLIAIPINNSTGKYAGSVASYASDTSITLKTVTRATVGRENSLAPRWFTEPYGWYHVVSNYGNFQYYPAGASVVTIPSINNIDRTLTNIIKIIELPYAPTSLEGYPIKIPVGWEISYNNELGVSGTSPNVLKLKKLETEFKNELVVNESLSDELTTELPTLANRFTSLRNDNNETKLKNSAFNSKKYYYDTFAKELKLEDIEWLSNDTTPALNINFKASNTMNSNLLYEFIISNANVRYSEDYPKVLIASRNNEYPVYNSSYINYLRTGYQYDLQRNANAAQNRWSALGFSVASTAGAVAASFIPGGQVIGAAAALSMGLNTLQTIRNNINTGLQADEQQRQALDQQRQQSASISGSSDLNLFNYYSNNKLKVINYRVSEKTYKNIADLFYYTGYNVEQQGVPNIDSRRSFNYIQCDPVLSCSSEVLKYLEDIKTRFNQGVTVYHKFYNGSAYIYDLSQRFENWETWVCPRNIEN